MSRIKRFRVQRFRNIFDSGWVELEPRVTTIAGLNESGKSSLLAALHRLNPPDEDPGFELRADYPNWRVFADAAEEAVEALPPPVEVEIEFEIETKGLSSTTARVGRDYRGVLSVDPIGKGGDGPTVPEVHYFADYALVPDRIDLWRLFGQDDYLPQEDKGELREDELAARALLRLANVRSGVVDMDAEQARLLLETAQARLTKRLLRHWRNDPNLGVRLDLESDTTQTAQNAFRYLVVKFQRKDQEVSIRLGRRSRGFRDFFSFVTAFSEFESNLPTGVPVLILLDEPGRHLHPCAQSDLRYFIDEVVAEEHQVVLATNSPSMAGSRPQLTTRVMVEARDQGMPCATVARPASMEEFASVFESPELRGLFEGVTIGETWEAIPPVHTRRDQKTARLVGLIVEYRQVTRLHAPLTTELVLAEIRDRLSDYLEGTDGEVQREGRELLEACKGIDVETTRQEREAVIEGIASFLQSRIPGGVDTGRHRVPQDSSDESGTLPVQE